MSEWHPQLPLVLVIVIVLVLLQTRPSRPPTSITSKITNHEHETFPPAPPSSRPFAFLRGSLSKPLP